MGRLDPPPAKPTRPGNHAPPPALVPPSRRVALGRFAMKAKVSAITRLPAARRLATLIAFVHGLESSAHDDALEVLEIVLHDWFGQAMRADRKARLRTLKDLDQAATRLAETCKTVLDEALSDGELRAAVFAKTPREVLARALENVYAWVRPPDDVYFREVECPLPPCPAFPSPPRETDTIRGESRRKAGRGRFRRAPRECDSRQTGP